MAHNKKTKQGAAERIDFLRPVFQKVNGTSLTVLLWSARTICWTQRRQFGQR